LGRVFSSLPCLNDQDWVGSVFDLGCGGLALLVTQPAVFVNIFLLSETFVRAVLFGNTEGFSGFAIL
jgi:hypothetical protein